MNDQLKPEMERLDYRTKWALLVVSLLTVASLAWAALQENVYPEWREHRLEYARILEQKATDERGKAIAAQFQIGIDQNYVPGLNATDRCITCHTGLDDPRMTDAPQPFTTHPGTVLSDHPPEQFGCTICHDGQGRATESHDAHGRDPHWLYPMRDTKQLYSACTDCHGRDALLDESFLTELPAEEEPEGLALIARGKELLDANGCLGCHKLGDKGGTLGPDITYVGNKTRHEFDFSHFHGDEPHEVAHWLKKHFLEPQEISPGTLMPDLGLADPDAEALTAYVLSLRKPTGVLAYQGAHALDGDITRGRTGEELYRMMCASCHGANGEASEVPGIRTPALNNEDSLASSSDDYFRHIIYAGRSGTNMNAWGPDSGNLSHDEIDEIVAYIRAWEKEGASLSAVRSARGDARMGRAYYQGMCANCHGREGEGGIGVTLNSPTFLGLASDDFLAETIVHGRPGTAMASWKHLPAQAVSDLLAYIRTWQADPPTFDQVQRSLAAHSPESNRRFGEAIYRGNCIGCHGDNGDGGIGLRLSGPNIVPAVSDEFLYRTIVEGRPSTAMPAWPHLSSDELAGLITYLRSLQSETARPLEKAPAVGNYNLGAVHYAVACAQCHGDRGQGGVGPQIVNRNLLSAASDDVLYEWIARGRTGTAMKGFLPGEHGVVELAPHEIMDVIAWLRSESGNDDRAILRSGVGNPGLGYELYIGNCASCHGSYGEGASGPQLNNPTFLRTASDGFLAGTIATGRQGTAMHPMIHDYQGLGQLEASQVQDIVAFIRLWDFDETWEKPRSLAEISARAIRSGSEKFAQFCAGCHGTNGKGVADGPDFFAPALNNPEFLDAASDGFLLATIARGRSGTPMRPFGIGSGGIAKLDHEAIGDIVSYIRTWQEEYVTKGD